MMPFDLRTNNLMLAATLVAICLGFGVLLMAYVLPAVLRSLDHYRYGEADHRKYKALAFVIAFAAIPLAEIVSVGFGGRPNSFMWMQVQFLLVYWSLVAIISVPTGIMAGLVEVFLDR